MQRSRQLICSLPKVFVLSCQFGEAIFVLLQNAKLLLTFQDFLSEGLFLLCVLLLFNEKLNLRSLQRQSRRDSLALQVRLNLLVFASRIIQNLRQPTNLIGILRCLHFPVLLTRGQHYGDCSQKDAANQNQYGQKLSDKRHGLLPLA